MDIIGRVSRCVGVSMCVNRRANCVRWLDVFRWPGEDVHENQSSHSRIPQNPSEPLRTPQNPSKSLRIRQNPSESLRIPQNPSESLRIPQNPSESILNDRFQIMGNLKKCSPLDQRGNPSSSQQESQRFPAARKHLRASRSIQEHPGVFQSIQEYFRTSQSIWEHLRASFAP